MVGMGLETVNALAPSLNQHLLTVANQYMQYIKQIKLIPTVTASIPFFSDQLQNPTVFDLGLS